ncbi:Xaa-Pro peptidase family protein [bacterium]|nr:Xaa-Pro peptidase family protein [bacterium]
MPSIFTCDELLGRIRRLQDQMRKQSIDGALILQRVDMIYYTGVVFPGAVAIPATGDPRIFAWRRLHLFDDTSVAQPEIVKGMGHLFAVLGGDTGIAGWKHVGLEEDVLPVATYKALERKVWPDSDLVDISATVRTQRIVKSPAELDIIRRSGKVLAAGFESLREFIREGVHEYDAQARMDLVMRQHGDQISGRTRGFNAEAGGVVAAGVSAAVDNAFDGPIGQPGRNPLVPKGAGGKVIERGEPVICDHTAGVDGYMTDMTRTYCVGPVSELDPKFVDAHNFCVDLHKRLLDKTRAGAVPSELYAWSLEQANDAGYADNFMNMGRNRVRFIGHGVGMELDEWPVIAKGFDQPLEAGTVLAIEPKIIFPEGGVGVEDTVIVHNDQPAEVVTPMEYEIQPTG